MSRLLRKLEQVFAAVAFAECGDFDTALAIYNEDSRPKNKKDNRPTPPRYRARA